MGETVDIYRDLGVGQESRRGYPDREAFSVRYASGHPGSRVGLVVASTVGIELTGGRPAWARAAKAGAEATGRRGVHAFIRGEVRRYLTPAVARALVKGPGWAEVTYYPGSQDFFAPVGRRRFLGASRVVLAGGKFYAFRPEWSTSVAPVSPIERRLAAAS